MMTTAYNTVDADGAEVTDPFAQGAGHVDPTSYLEPGLTYLSDINDWAGYVEWLGYDVGVEPIAGYDLNLASYALGTLTAPVTVHRSVTSTQAGTWEASVDVPGIDAVVEPSTLTFGGAGETQSFTVTLQPHGCCSRPVRDRVPDLERTDRGAQPRGCSARDDRRAARRGRHGRQRLGGCRGHPGGTGPIELGTTGLSVGTVQGEESAVNDERYEYSASVPEGAVFARFDLDVLDDELAHPVDFDLFVYLLNDEGTPIALWQSGIRCRR